MNSFCLQDQDEEEQEEEKGEQQVEEEGEDCGSVYSYLLHVLYMRSNRRPLAPPLPSPLP